MAARHFSKVFVEGTATYPMDSNRNTLQNLSRPLADFIKCPVNIAEVNWKDFRLYVRFLDLKVQNPDLGTFDIHHSARYYQRTIKKLIEKGWAQRNGRRVYLRAYQHVWRDLGISRVRSRGLLRFRYWKIPVENFSLQRSTYLKQIENYIRTQITKRKLAQMRFALKNEGTIKYEETFSAKSAGNLFGYRSTSSGSKLRRKYFEIIAQTPEESKPRFMRERGRWEEPTKKIAI